MTALDHTFLRIWSDAVGTAAAAITATLPDTLGYPAGDNMIRLCGPQDQDSIALMAQFDVPEDLLALYRVIVEVSLPDVGNGWFIHSVEWLASSLEAPQVRAITGRHHAEVIVFGSDGGGTLYAVAIPGGAPVYRLPPGEVLDGVYHSQDAGFDLAAPDLRSFLIQLRERVEQFAVNDPGHDW